MEIDFLKPVEQHRVIDLVESAGIDVSDWGNFRGGHHKAAMNPKYCYEWTYCDEQKKILALNLWFKNTQIVDGEISQQLNLRVAAENSTSAIRKRRAISMDLSLQKGAWQNWTVRVIMLDGDDEYTRADSRMLDIETWYVKSYSSETGDCLLARGRGKELYVDQFEIEYKSINKPEKKQAVSTAYERCPKVRRYALDRAAGRCEWCDEIGFETTTGSIYLETHHIQPLYEDGDDSIDNVIAICPNHHREAHYGRDADRLRKLFIDCVKKRNN